jgi:hypothetical protein
MFFFEKKNQKTFAGWGARWVGCVGGWAMALCGFASCHEASVFLMPSAARAAVLKHPCSK